MKASVYKRHCVHYWYYWYIIIVQQSFKSKAMTCDYNRSKNEHSAFYISWTVNKKHVMGIHWCTSPTRCEAALTRWASELLHTGTPSEQVMVNSFMIPTTSAMLEKWLPHTAQYKLKLKSEDLTPAGKWFWWSGMPRKLKTCTFGPNPHVLLA